MPNLHSKHATHHGPPQAQEEAGRAGAIRRMKQLLLVLCAAQLMVILDITAVNVALPDLAQGLGIKGGDIGWTITSYSLIFGSLLLLGGRAADLVGQRRMFMTGLAVFTLASIAAATAGGAGTLFAARAPQGLGRGDALAGRPLHPDEHLPRRHTRVRTPLPPGAPSAGPAPRSESCSAER